MREIALAVLLAVAFPVLAGANDLPFFGRSTFGITAAAQAFDARTHQHPHPNKYDEHADTPEGFALDELFVASANARRRAHFSLRALDAGQGDQRVDADAGVFGRWRAQMGFTAVPSRFARATRTPFSHLGHGRLVVDEAIRRDLEEAHPEELVARVRRVATTSHPSEVAFRRNALTSRAMWRPQEWLELRVRAREEARNGSRPYSIGSFDVQPAGVSAVLFEFAEPVEVRTHEVVAGFTIRGRNWHVDVDGSASRFRNTIAFIDYDNPFRVTHAASAGSTGRMRAARGHVAPAPNTTGQSLTMSGAVAIGERGHAGASLAWIDMTQDQRFVPWTLNLAIPGSGLPEGLGPTNLEALPRASLQGRARLLSTDDSLAFSVTRDLTLTLRYRDDDFASRTPDLAMPGYAGEGDSNWLTEFRDEPVVARGHSFRRQAAQSDLTWDHKPFRARLTHEREIWTRQPRDERRSEQDSVTGALQFRTERWHARTRARHTRRNGEEFRRNAVIGPDTANLQRNEVTAFTVWMPNDRLSVDGAVAAQRSAYGDAAALRSVSVYDAGVGMRVAVGDSLEVAIRVSRDHMAYRYLHDDAWGRNVRDGSNAFGADVVRELGRLSIRAAWERAIGKQRIEVLNTDDVRRWPTIRTSWQRVEGGVELELTPRWRSGIRYRYSPFTVADYASDDLSVYPFDAIDPATDARRVILLDARYAGHEVHVLALYFRLTAR